MTADSFETNLRDVISNAFPDLSQEELSAAIAAFLGYIDVVNDIHDGLVADPRRCIPVTLTGSIQQGTVEAGQVEPKTN
jgi:hypothetical protein